MASTRLLYCFFLTNFLIVYMITRVNRIIESNNFFGNIHDVPDFSYLSYLTYLKQPSRPVHQIQKEKRKNNYLLFLNQREALFHLRQRNFLWLFKTLKQLLFPLENAHFLLFETSQLLIIFFFPNRYKKNKHYQ